MRDHMRETEKDTIDVVTFLKKQDVDKDVEVRFLFISTIIRWKILRSSS